MQLAITSNGPGEFAGWVRPLLHALYARRPDTGVAIFFVPDDYATGREAAVARRIFPQARAFTPAEYLRFALGARLAEAPTSADLVLYLGGDLSHAARTHRRLGGRAQAYKFSRPRYRSLFERVYAVDAANALQLKGWGVPGERIETVGNLAVDGALLEAAGAFSAVPVDPGAVDGGILIMPGTRRREIANLIPFFLATADWLRRFLGPAVPIAFGLSPFTTSAEIAAALERGGDPRFWGSRGRLEGDTIVAAGSGQRFGIVHDAMRYAPRARTVITIPGTKCIELAVLGVPAIVCIPLNAPELAVLNGPLTYLDRIPFAGAPLKRALITQLGKRYPLLAQPNIDAGDQLMPELRGALMPGRVARVAADYSADDAARSRAAARLAPLYAHHRGAAERMARALVEAG